MEKDYLLKKWLNDDLTEEERMEFEAMEDRTLDERILKEAKRFKAAQFSSAPDFTTIENQLNSQTTASKRQWLRPLISVAAAFVVGLGLYTLLFSNATTQIQTLASEKTTIELPDASQVTLNALSELSYKEKRWNSNRQVSLDGEAFFIVAKGKTFDVLTDQGTITVVGTQFNVKERLNFFEVVCYEGIVSVTSNGRTEQLNAGTSLRLVNGQMQLNSTVFTVPQWTKSVSDFKAVAFAEVVSELERQYAVKISFPNEKSSLQFTGGFVHDDLNNALISITQPLDLNYIIESSNQVRLYSSE